MLRQGRLSLVLCSTEGGRLFVACLPRYHRPEDFCSVSHGLQSFSSALAWLLGKCHLVCTAQQTYQEHFIRDGRSYEYHWGVRLHGDIEDAVVALGDRR